MPAFVHSYELPYEVENLSRLRPVVDEMVAQLCDFLRHRELCASTIELSLLHERREATQLDVGLRQASRSQQHLMLLIDTHLDTVVVGTRAQGHDDLFQRTVTGPLTDAIDGALDLSCACNDGHQAVGDRHTEIVMAVDADDGAVTHGLHHAADELPVLVRYGPAHRVGQVHALAVRQHATEDHLGRQLRRLRLDDLDAQAAVIEQQIVADPCGGEDLGMRQEDARRITRRLVSIENEDVVGQQLGFLRREGADADFRALQVDQNTDLTTEPMRDVAHGCSTLGVLLGCSVRKIQANDVDARADELKTGNDLTALRELKTVETTNDGTNAKPN